MENRRVLIWPFMKPIENSSLEDWRLYQENQWADEAQREREITYLCGELEVGNLGSIKFCKTTVRHAQIRERKGSIAGSHAKMCTSGANAVAPKFEDGTQDEPLKQERFARRDAWDLAKDVFQLTRRRYTFYFPAEAWVMPGPSSKKPGERGIRDRLPERPCTC